VTNVYIDNLPAARAQNIFNAFADKDYLSNAECNLNGHNSSVRLEAYSRFQLFDDLAVYFDES
jgi:hypothetical protein